jgi:hypothetical protein
MKNELYFCLKLTENEHYIVEDMLQAKCQELNCKLLYYRKLKDGHVPMYREVKIIGNNINKIKVFLSQEMIEDNIEKNPYKE